MQKLASSVIVLSLKIIWFIVFLPCSFLLYYLVSLGLCTSIMIVFIVILICVDLV